MGVAQLLTPCINCGATFSCHPHKVPSIRVNGKKEPLCETCAKRWIELHPEANFTIPEGAYESCNEDEL